MNDDYILVNDFHCMPTALLFNGHSVVCVPRHHTDSVVDCLDHGEECTELQIQCTVDRQGGTILMSMICP